MKTAAQYLEEAIKQGPNEYGTLGGRIVGQSVAEAALAQALEDARIERYQLLLSQAIKNSRSDLSK